MVLKESYPIKAEHTTFNSPWELELYKQINLSKKQLSKNKPYITRQKTMILISSPLQSVRNFYSNSRAYIGNAN